MVRIPEDKVILEEGEERPSPRAERITFAQAVEENPEPDWYYWLARLSWTPEEATQLFLSKDPHTSNVVRNNPRAFKQVMDALSERGHMGGKPPREWAEILLSLPCFGGAQGMSHLHHPFKYLSEYFGDKAPTPQERIADLGRQLAEARQERDALAVEVGKLRAEGGAEPDARSRKTLQAIIAALACGGGDVEALRDRNLVGKITKAMGLLGIKRSDDAVRKALKQLIGFIEEERA